MQYQAMTRPTRKYGISNIRALLRFDSWKHPFGLQLEMCMSPECTCQDIVLVLVELIENLPASEKQRIIRVRIHEDTCVEEEPPEREPREAALVAELLRDLPKKQLADWAAYRKMSRDHEQRLREKKFEPSDIENGFLVSYTHIVDPAGSVMEGGSAAPYSLEHEGRRFYLDDLYCANPECDCRVTHLFFLEVIEKGPETAHLEDLFHVRVPFKGRPRLGDCPPEMRPLAQTLLQLWAKKYPKQQSILKRHYAEIKKIAARSFKDGATRGGQKPQPLKRRQKVGRNESCPCGSGKKYKKCCGR
jgi:hypothetical protein